MHRMCPQVRHRQSRSDDDTGRPANRALPVLSLHRQQGDRLPDGRGRHRDPPPPLVPAVQPQVHHDRFASVYRAFESLDDFAAEIAALRRTETSGDPEAGTDRAGQPAVTG